MQPLYFLNPKFQASSHLLELHSLVCVGPGRKPERLFSHDAAHFSVPDSSDTEEAFLDLNLSIHNDMVSTMCVVYSLYPNYDSAI